MKSAYYLLIRNDVTGALKVIPGNAIDGVGQQYRNLLVEGMDEIDSDPATPQRVVVIGQNLEPVTTLIRTTGHGRKFGWVPMSSHGLTNSVVRWALATLEAWNDPPEITPKKG